MKGSIIISVGVVSLFSMIGPATAETYTRTTVTNEETAPVEEFRTTTIEAPQPVTVVRETKFEESAPTTTVIKERHKHTHLLKVPFMTVD